MSVSYYDNAMVKKITGWIKDNRVKVLGVEDTLRTFQLTSDKTNDSPISLPLISLSRGTNIELSFNHKKPMSFDGMMIAHPDIPENISDEERQVILDNLQEEGKLKSLQVNAIPMTLNYQLDIYTKKLSEADEYVRNFVFNFINHPKLTIELPYQGVNYKHDFNIVVNNPIQDNSDIPNRLFGGQFYRWTINLTIDDAYLFSVPFEDLVSVDSVEINMNCSQNNQ